MTTAKFGLPDNQNYGNRDYRLYVAIAALVGLATIFWLSSRYPALNEKALMGGDTPLSGLSFDIAIRIFPNSGIVWEIIANTANWISTNLLGMTFGVLFGAALLTLLSLVKKRSFEGSFANAALGAAIGAPLGVCVNCAAPIALGLHAGRMRLETTLAALLASPTLNIIVVTMSFALLPLYLAAIKLALALLMVLVAIPLLCKYVLVTETTGPENDTKKMAEASQPKGVTGWMLRVLSPKDADPAPHNSAESLVWFSRNYARNFFFIFIVTVPMMFLAALLGALVVTITRPGELIDLLPQANLVLTLLALLAVALVTSFVPAPIALDVILVAILVGIGLKAHYAVAMVIGLGSFSIYAFIILWRAISLRTAVSLWILVIVFAVIGGILGRFAGQAEERYDIQQRIAILKSKESIEWPKLLPLPPAQKLTALKSKIDQQKIQFRPLPAKVESDGGSLVNLSFGTTGAGTVSSGAKGTKFTRIIGPEIGLNEKGVLSSLKIFGPYNMHGGIAAGDVHNDGWTDIVTSRSIHQTGFSLYANLGGKYVRQHIDLGPLEKLDFRNLALVDINGDQRLDIIGATYGQGTFAFFNEHGGFDYKRSALINNKDGVLAVGMAFADFDNDGDIDIAFGNWTTPSEHDRGRNIALSAHNNIAWNDGKGSFDSDRLPGFPGATLTTLASDFDRDGNIDILIGDDLRSTDNFLMSNGDRSFRSRQFGNTIFPYTMESTMNYTQGDWNNDLIPDYYGAQVAIQGNKDTRRDHSGSRAYDICAQFTADLGRWEYDTAACAKRLISMDFIDRSNMR
ncbi:MAG: FG-GAP-like repeat-containing protein, partial [Parvularculaceae bacterium]